MNHPRPASFAFSLASALAVAFALMSTACTLSLEDGASPFNGGGGYPAGDPAEDPTTSTTGEATGSAVGESAEEGSGSGPGEEPESDADATNADDPEAGETDESGPAPADGGSTSDGGSSSGDGERGSSDGPAPGGPIPGQPASGMYAHCTAPEDCGASTPYCVTTTDDSGVVDDGYCTADGCTNPAVDCDASPGGGAVPVCDLPDGVTSVCALSCAGGLACPTGMTCYAFVDATLCM